MIGIVVAVAVLVPVVSGVVARTFSRKRPVE